MKSRSILLFGDVHGRFDHAIHEALARRPVGVIFLDSEARVSRMLLVGSMSLRKTVWSPDLQQFDGKTAGFKSFKEFATQRILATPGPARFKEQGITAEQAIASLDDPKFHANVLFGSEILHLSSIFPEDFQRMANLQADVLITHEAPSCHPYGHIGIDHLARAMGAKLVVHGHHHDSLDYSAEQKRMGFACVGVGFRGIAELDLNSLEVRVVRQGDYDVERAGRMRLSLIPQGH